VDIVWKGDSWWHWLGAMALAIAMYQGIAGFGSRQLKSAFCCSVFSFPTANCFPCFPCFQPSAFCRSALYFSDLPTALCLLLSETSPLCFLLSIFLMPIANCFRISQLAIANCQLKYVGLQPLKILYA
jgi:hypothetical protein